MNPYDCIGSIFWFAVGLYVCIIAYFSLGFGTFREPGSGFIFTLSGFLLLILSLIDLIRTFIKKIEHKTPVWSGLNWGKVILVLVGLSAYVYLCGMIGFTISSFLLMLFLFKVVETSKWWIAIVNSLIILLIVYVIFSIWLKVSFPKGFWGI